MLDLIELGDFDLTYTWDLCSSSKEFKWILGFFYHVINCGCWFTQGIVNLYITTVQTFIEQYVCVLFVFEQLGLMSSTLNADVLDAKIGLKLETVE